MPLLVIGVAFFGFILHKQAKKPKKDNRSTAPSLSDQRRIDQPKFIK